MSFELFIVKRIYFNKEKRKKVSPPAVRIAMAGVALGLSIMILSVAIIVGFKKEIRQRISGFGAHIQITNFDNNTSYQTHPIAQTDSLMQLLGSMPEIKGIDLFATKPGILKTNDDFLGVVLKGINKDYNTSFIESCLVEGTMPRYNDSIASNEIVVSRQIADKLNLKVGDPIFSYFVQDNVRVRKFKVVAIYETNFSDYDNVFIIGDLAHAQQLNGWQPDQVSGMEVTLNDYGMLDEVSEELYFKLIDMSDPYGATYFARSITELNPQIFNWLALLDMNVWVILALMSIVAGFTMISGLLIIILERANMIGILKALGAPDKSIRKIFIYISLFLVGKGMLWGNIIGVTICMLQSYFQIFKLNAATYYIPAVPIDFNILYWILLNVGSFMISLTMLIGPSHLVSKISPAQSIRFE